MTLTADADWRDKGTVTIPAGVTVNLNGHSLKLAGIAGSGTIDNPVVDLTTPDPEGLRVTATGVSRGSAVNLFNNNFTRNGTDNTRRIVVFLEGLPFRVDYDFGEGNEQAINRYKVYCGPIPGYTVRCPKSWTFEGSNDKEEWTLLDSRQSETGWTIAASASECRTKDFENTTRYRYYRFSVTAVQSVTSDNTFEMVQLEYFDTSASASLWLDIPAGTTVTNSGVTISGNIQLVKDGAGTFVASKAGQTYSKGTRVVAGTFACNGRLGANLVGDGGRILVEDGAIFDDDGWQDLRPYEIRLEGGTLANTVSGFLTMLMNNAYNYEIQDGATVELAEWTDVLNSTGTASGHGLVFAPNATITMNLAGRTLTLGEKLVRWTAKMRPAADVTFKFDDTTAQGGIEPVATDTGLFYGVDPDSSLAEYADWTGAGNDGNIGNPANWICTNVAGNPIANGLPSAITTVRLSGGVDLQIPIGVTLPHEELELNNCQLGADCDWRGLSRFEMKEGSKLDLNGHELRLVDLAGSGTIYNPLVDLTTTESSRVTSTAVSKGSAANLFNNNFTRNGTDNTRRIVVYLQSLPFRVDYDFGEGNEQAINRYKVYCGPISGYTVRCPKSWTFEGSNDKVTWTVLDSRQSETGWSVANSASECRTKDFENTTRYRYYRFSVTAVQSVTSDNTLEMVQLEYFDTSASAPLCLDIPEGVVVDNRNVTFDGNVRIVKEGAGKFIASKANQKYFGGTQVDEGQLTCGTPTGLGTEGMAAVDPDGVLEVNGCGDIYKYSFVLNGGTLQNTLSDVGEGTAQIARLRLTASSTFKPTCSYGLIGSGYTATTLDLGGQTLTVPIGDDKKFYLFNTTVTAGTIDVSGDGWLVADKTAVNASATDLRVNCALDIRVPFSVGSYEALYAGDNDAGSQPLTVTGVFTPHGSRYHGVILENNATLDLSKCTTALNVVSMFAGQQLTFAPGAMVTLDLGDRRGPGGSKVVEWDEKPEDLQPQQFKVKANGRRKYYVAFGDDGIYLKSGLAIYFR